MAIWGLEGADFGKAFVAGQHVNATPRSETGWVDGAPEIISLAVGPHEHLVEVPLPLGRQGHLANPIAADLGCEQRAEPVPPKPHRVMADFDPTFVQQVLDVAQREQCGTWRAGPQRRFLRQFFARG